MQAAVPDLVCAYRDLNLGLMIVQQALQRLNHVPSPLLFFPLETDLDWSLIHDLPALSS